MNNFNGLSKTEVAERQVQYGPNALPVLRYRLLRLILRQFRGVFNLLLLGAAGVTFALGEPIDGSFILLFVFLGINSSHTSYARLQSGVMVKTGKCPSLRLSRVTS
jgi:magnesium-transporting ATPase (P-type)